MDNGTTQHVNGASNGSTQLPVVDFRALREGRKKSINDVAKRLGFSGPSLTNVETRRQQPGAYLLVALADYYGVSLESAWATYRPGDSLPTMAEIIEIRADNKRRQPKKAKPVKKPQPNVAAKPAAPPQAQEDEVAAEDQAMLLKTLKDLVVHELRHGRSAIELIRIIAQLDEERIESMGPKAA